LDKNVKNELIWEADGFAAVLPSDKREVVLTLRNDYGVVCGMTGDGVNDAPALSAAQVGIAVEGATDAAKNAADLILTKPGLSPIYGAVVESRRIFAKVKSYVVYRIAASITLVLTLSIIVFVSNCTVDSLMIIVLALLNDISMIPVAYDNAYATRKPQMAVVLPLVVLSAFYGVIQTGFALVYFYPIANNHGSLGFDLDTCDGPTQGQIWLYLLLCTELMIFSTRAPGFFFTSVLSLMLLGSVSFTIALGIILTRYIARFHVPGKDIGWIVLANVSVFLIVDMAKVAFRIVIGDGDVEVIKSDELLEIKVEEENEVTKALKKKMRYEVHRESIVAPKERNASFISFDTSTLAGKIRAASTISDGFIKRGGGKTSMDAKASIRR
jgi:H+-transporting ATPase